MIDLAIDSRIFITNNLDAALQELDILFNTEYTELIGDTTFGTNFEQFLWNLNPSTDSMKQYIEDKICEGYYLTMFNHDIDIDIVQGEYRYIYRVRINLYKDGQSGTREYEFR